MRLLAAIFAVLIAVSPGTANAVVQTADAVSISQNAKWYAVQATREMEQLARWAEQINNLTSMLTLQNLASTVLGEGMGGEFSALANSATGMYRNTSSLIGNLQAKQYQLQNELNSLMLPANVSSMTGQQMMALAQRYRTFFANDTITARAIQAEGIALQNQVQQEAMNGVRQSDRSKSALSATQALTHVAGAISSQLHTQNMALGTLAMNIESAHADEITRENVGAEMNRRNAEKMREWSVGNAARTEISPVYWGRK